MIKITISLILGIVLAHSLNTSLSKIVCIATFTILVFVILYYIFRKKQCKSILFGTFSYLGMISLGLLTYAFHDQLNWSDHYTKIIHPNEINSIQIQVKERLKPGIYNDKYVVQVISVDRQECSGKLLLNIKRDSINNTLNVDDRFLIPSKLVTINKPLNPNQFNYNNYLKRQYIYHQLTVSNELLYPIQNNSRSMIAYASDLRHRINQQLESHKFNEQQMAIINALFLGQRQNLDRELYENYVKAGAIHILAISGLHVGIILILLNRILKPLEYLKNGRLIKAILIVILLWSFAIIAGLSASVTRAVAMFSIFSIAMHLKRPTNVYNTLAISIFFILLVKPMFLFDVGFQMSYVAVLAIVSIQPELYKFWTPNFKIVDHLWQILTVTLAAQIGVAPISLFYFHQFPGLFFASNMAIIPFLGFILGFGLITIGLAIFDILPQHIASSFAFMIDIMNSIVEWISSKEQFVIKNISFELPELMSAYFLLILVFSLVKFPSYKRIRRFLVSLIVIQLLFFTTKLIEPKDSFIIFHKSRKTLIGQHRHNKLTIWHNLDAIQIEKSKEIQDYCISNYISLVDYHSLQNVYRTQASLLMVIDSLSVYKVSRFKPHYILLRNSPK